MVRAVHNVAGPVEFPAQDEIKALTQTGIPLLQNKDIQEKISAAAVSFLPQVLTELLGVAVPEALAAALQRFAKWAGEQEPDKRRELIRLVITQDDENLNAFLQAESLQGAVVRAVIW
jgi:FdhE protein